MLLDYFWWRDEQPSGGFFDYPGRQKAAPSGKERELPEIPKGVVDLAAKVIAKVKCESKVDKQFEPLKAEAEFKKELSDLKVKWTIQLAELIALEYLRLDQEQTEAEIVWMLFEM